MFEEDQKFHDDIFSDGKHNVTSYAACTLSLTHTQTHTSHYIKWKAYKTCHWTSSHALASLKMLLKRKMNWRISDKVCFFFGESSYCLSPITPNDNYLIAPMMSNNTNMQILVQSIIKIKRIIIEIILIWNNKTRRTNNLNR